MSAVGGNARSHIDVVRHRANNRFDLVRDRTRQQFDLVWDRVEPALGGTGRRMLLAVTLLLGFALAVATTSAVLPDSQSTPTAAARTGAPLDQTALLDQRGADARADRANRGEPTLAEDQAAELAEELTARAAAPEESPEPTPEAEEPEPEPEETKEPEPEPEPEKTEQRDWVHPMPGTATTSCYGPRWGTMHAGVDLAGPQGTPIQAVGAGTVIHAGWVFSGYGISVVIHHPNGYQTHYAHASEAKVSVGDKVTPGQVIALEGSTGDSTGPHLHFEVHQGMWNQIEPVSWLRDRAVYIDGC